MVEIKFIVGVVLAVITLAIILWWVYTNYSSLLTAFQNWISDVMSWG